MSLYGLTYSLADALSNEDYARVREIITKCPKHKLINLLGVIGVFMANKEIDIDTDVSKALMIYSCENGLRRNDDNDEQQDIIDELWNFAMHDDVPIHFDNYKPFYSACKSNNVSMLDDFHQFQSDDTDNVIPPEVWKRGLKVAQENDARDAAEWLVNYIDGGYVVAESESSCDDENNESDVESERTEEVRRECDNEHCDNEHCDNEHCDNEHEKSV